MNSRPQFHSRTVAFTLVELLTVITIIAILMGLLFPAIGIAKDQARKAQAKNDVSQISAAVKQYYTEYGKYPMGSANPGANTSTDVLFGDSTVPGAKDNAIVFNALRNLADPLDGNNYNPRAIVFFDGKIVADSNVPRAGFLTQASGNMQKGAYVDPWGHEYCISIDADYDNTIKNLPYNDFSTTANYPMTGIAVFSLGKDGKLGNNGDSYVRNPGRSSASDDIVSWQ